MNWPEVKKLNWRGGISVVVFFLLWHMAVVLKLSGFAELPTPLEVVRTFLFEHVVDKDYWISWWISFKRVVAGFLIAQVIGIPIGLAFGGNRVIRDLFYPVFELLRPIPPLAWVPVSILFWPTNESSIIFITFIGAFFVIVVNVFEGMTHIKKEHIWLAQSLGAKRTRMFLKIIIPSVIPSIAVGMTLGIAITWNVVIAAEMIASDNGLGRLTWEGYVSSTPEVVIVGMISIGFAGYLSTLIVDRIESKMMPWKTGYGHVTKIKNEKNEKMKNEKAVGQITARNISKSYYTHDGECIEIIKNLSVTIAPGELNVIMGVSGCGKSTLAYMFAGYIQPDHGTLEIDDKPICGADPERIMVFQETALWPWQTVLDNVIFGPQVRGEMSTRQAQKEARNLLREFGLEQFVDKYPDQLSGGMKRRAEIAQALINKPSVMILDEPFRGLDVMTRELLQEYYLALYESRRLATVFITSEVEEAIFLADTIYVMADKPGYIKKQITVPLARPRTLESMTSDAYFKVEQQLMASLYSD